MAQALSCVVSCNCIFPFLFKKNLREAGRDVENLRAAVIEEYCALSEALLLY